MLTGHQTPRNSDAVPTAATRDIASQVSGNTLRSMDICSTSTTWPEQLPIGPWDELNDTALGNPADQDFPVVPRAQERAVVPAVDGASCHLITAPDTQLICITEPIRWLITALSNQQSNETAPQQLTETQQSDETELPDPWLDMINWENHATMNKSHESGELIRLP